MTQGGVDFKDFFVVVMSRAYVVDSMKFHPSCDLVAAGIYSPIH